MILNYTPSLKMHSHNFLTLNQLSVIFILIISLLVPAVSQAEEWTYTTRPNDTIWDISKKYLKDVSYWQRLQTHNTVVIAKHLAPGTKLQIPIEWLKIQAAPALVVSVTGNVDLKISDDMPLKSLQSKQLVNIGDTILTGDNGSALIQFADASTLLVQKNSQVIFNTLSAYGQTGMVDTQLRLQQGRVETSVKPLKSSISRFEITTPAAVAAVRGTQFRVAYTNDKEVMASEVVEGNINVAAEGVTQEVPNGFGTITETGKAPQAPVQLLDAPNLSDLPTKILYLPFSFKWPTLDSASQYRIQISPSAQADALALEGSETTSTYTLNTLNDGKYILRVRGVDNNNLEGFNAEHVFEISTDFPAVTLISPLTQSVKAAKPIIFEWTEEKKATQYHLQVSSNIEFSNIVVDAISDINNFTLKDGLSEKRYFWRVMAVDKDGNDGKPSSTETFSVSKNHYEAFLLFLYFLPALFL